MPLGGSKTNIDPDLLSDSREVQGDVGPGPFSATGWRSRGYQANWHCPRATHTTESGTGDGG